MTWRNALQIKKPQLVRQRTYVLLTTKEKPLSRTENNTRHHQRRRWSMRSYVAPPPSERDEQVLPLSIVAIAIANTDGPDIMQILGTTITTVDDIQPISSPCSYMSIPRPRSDKYVMLKIYALPTKSKRVIPLAQSPEVVLGDRIVGAWQSS
jgi:hypothetical protein